MINELLMSSAPGRCGQELCPFDVDMSPLPCRWRPDLLVEEDTWDVVLRSAKSGARWCPQKVMDEFCFQIFWVGIGGEEC